MARVAKRTKRRVTCRLLQKGRVYAGVILDLSATGLFVQTHARPSPNERVNLELSVPGQRRPLRLEAVLARIKVVPPQLLNVAQGGVGLRITNAPEEYFAFLSLLMPKDALRDAAPFDLDAETEAGDAAAGAPAPASPPAGQAFRVRVSQQGGARTRTLRIVGVSADEAASLALAETGAGWRVLEAVPDDEAAAGRG